MAIAGFIIGVIGLLGVAFGLLCALKLRQWERQLAGARIALAYKQKVKLDAPLVEWLGWANMLGKDQQSTGRVVYRMGGTSVAIIKPRPASHGKVKTHTIKEKQAA